MGTRAFNKVQYGKEVTKGTEVNAAKIFLGNANVPSDRSYVFPNYNLALKAKAKEAHLYQQLVDGFTLDVENGYYQCLPMLFSMLLKGNVTATGTPNYSWVFTPSLTATNNQDSFTFEVGDDVEQYLLLYTMAKRLTISGGMGQNQAVKLSAECFAKSMAATDFTAALSLPTTVEPMVANNAKLHTAATWAGLSSPTQKTGLLRDFSLEIISGLHPKFHGNGLTFDAHGETYIDAMLRLTLEGNADADTWFDAYMARTAMALRLEIPGSALGAGTYNLTVDLWGVFEEMQPMAQETDGDNLHTALFHGLYDTTGAAMIAATVVTSENAV